MGYVGVTAFLLVLVTGSLAFYLPGVAPRDYDPGEPVELKVNKLTSVHTQLPYKYYYLPFCKPDQIIDKVENLGEILRGDRIENSLYQIHAKVDDQPCKVLCDKEYNKKQIASFADFVEKEYRVHWIVDNLPAAVPRSLQDPSTGKTTTIYESGYPLGFTEEIEDKSAKGGKRKLAFINNHVNIKLFYHTNPEAYQGLRIVGFEVEPESIQHSFDYNLDDPSSYPKTCNQREKNPLLVLDRSKDKTKIVWTYSVKWEYSDTPWANRWDKYFANIDPQIHWFSIINSLMIVLFLTGMVAMIMMRTLRADLRRYNQMEPNEEVEETGWKLVHGDIFRPPSHPLFLSVLIGSGVQVLGMGVVTMLFAVLGFLSPANRGGLMTAVIVLFVVMGSFGGYFAERNYKMFKGQSWKKATVATAFFFPGDRKSVV